MKTKILVTGCTGMIGTEFVKQYSDIKYEVFGIARNTSSSRLSGKQEKWVTHADILDEENLRKIVNKINPNVVIHLAAQAFNGDSWNMENYTHMVNYQGTLNLLRVCRDVVPKAKIMLACSSAEYGIVDKNDSPIKENRMLRPITPYGVSKVGEECLGYQYYKNYAMKVYLPRLFIHLGTGHPPATAVQNFARQLALIKNGLQSPIIKVGDTSTSRDFIDVRDGVRAMCLLIKTNRVGEPVNICTAKSYKISWVLKKLIEISGLKNIKVIRETSLFRSSDEKKLVGDNSKIVNLGWKQRYSIEETLLGVYEDWLTRI